MPRDSRAMTTSSSRTLQKPKSSTNSCQVVLKLDSTPSLLWRLGFRREWLSMALRHTEQSWNNNCARIFTGCHCYWQPSIINILSYLTSIIQFLHTESSQNVSFHTLPHLPLTVSHLHGLQFGVGSSVKAFHLLLLQTFKKTDGVLVDSTSLCQHQWGGSIVVTLTQDGD